MTLRSASTIPALLAALALAQGVAHADPTTDECLGATEAALKAGREHRLRAQQAQLLVCAAQSCPADVRKDCAGQLDQVSGQIPTLIFAARDAAGGDLGAVRITMDGELLAERIEGVAIAVDPGDHAFTFETPGQPSITRTLLIVQGEKDRRETIVFEGGMATPTPAPAPPTAPIVAPPPAASSVTGLGAQRILALVAGGVGVVGLGLGTAFGVIALSKKNDAQSVCSTDPCPTVDGSNKWGDAATAGNVSTVAFIVGGVALAGGAVLWLTAPRSTSASTPQVGLGLGSIQWRGAW
jgi:hypothetical protein